MDLDRARKGPSLHRCASHWIGTHHAIFHLGDLAAHRTCATCRETCLDRDEPAVACSACVVSAIDDGLGYRRIALAFALSVPLYRNLEYGQLYVFLLLLIAAACWALSARISCFGRWAHCDCRSVQDLSGSVLCLLSATKGLACVDLGSDHGHSSRRYLRLQSLAGTCIAPIYSEILPWALHGGGLQPYQAGASISGVLHSLFLSEPQWNPHPWHYSPLGYALLVSTFKCCACARNPLDPQGRCTRDRILLEWSALLTGILAVSTIPASYNFVLMVMPHMCRRGGIVRRGWYRWLVALLVVYLGIGFPMPIPHGTIGPAILLYVPRLPLMFALLFGIYGCSGMMLRARTLRGTGLAMHGLRRWPPLQYSRCVPRSGARSPCGRSMHTVCHYRPRDFSTKRSAEPLAPKSIISPSPSPAIV